MLNKLVFVIITTVLSVQVSQGAAQLMLKAITEDLNPN